MKLSETIDFDQSSVYPPVSGALAVISDNHGVIVTLNEISAGNYVTTRINGIPGYTYTLSVLSKEKNYQAESTMPGAVNIDSIYTGESLFGGDKQVKNKV